MVVFYVSHFLSANFHPIIHINKEIEKSSHLGKILKNLTNIAYAIRYIINVIIKNTENFIMSIIISITVLTFIKLTSFSNIYYITQNQNKGEIQGFLFIILHS